MALSGILLSGLGLQDREQRQKERDSARQDDERRRRRRHRPHRHTGDGEYRSARTQGRQQDQRVANEDTRSRYTDAHAFNRTNSDYTSHPRSTVAARGPREHRARSNVAARAVAPEPREDGRRQSNRNVSMRRAHSTSASSDQGSDEDDTPPTTPGDAPHAKALSGSRTTASTTRPAVQMRSAPHPPRGAESSSEDDYSRLTPGKRKLRVGERMAGARGTDFMVGVRSDIGSITSGSDSDSEPEQAGLSTHLTIVTKPIPADKMMTGALPPGTTPHRTIGPPTSRPLVSRTNSRQSDGFLSQLLRPSPHHANVKRRSTVSTSVKSRPQPQTSPSKQSANRRSISSSAAPPAMARRRATALAVPTVQEAAPAAPPEPEPEPEPTLQCLTCCDDIPASKAAQLECEHVMCPSCLKHVFELSVKDPAHMPPKCCTEKHIPLKFVAPLFDNKFKVLWNKKFQEFSTKDRMYCPKKGCGEWIHPDDQKVDKAVGRRYGVCGKCKTKVCKKCNTKWHGSKDCHNDRETRQLLDTAKKEGWQRCYSCKAVVQLAEGCNHMKCRCTAEFCMICGSKWKTCDCPWFNTPPENDPMAAIFFPPPNLFRPRVRMQPDPDGGPAHAVLDPGGPRGQGGYAAQLAARRAQEQADEALARRLQMGDLANEHNPFAFQHHDHLFHRRLPRPGLGGGVAGGGHGVGLADGPVAALGVFAQLARLAIDNLNDDNDESDSDNGRDRRRRSVRLGRHTTVQAAWTRPVRRATTTGPRSRARAPDPPAPVDVVEYLDTQSDDDDDARSDMDEFEAVRRQRLEARRRRQSLNNGPSAAAMAGLGREGRRGRDRVGGWLDHIAGGGPAPSHEGTVIDERLLTRTGVFRPNPT